jgi:hypothetical protein
VYSVWVLLSLVKKWSSWAKWHSMITDTDLRQFFIVYSPTFFMDSLFFSLMKMLSLSVLVTLPWVEAISTNFGCAELCANWVCLWMLSYHWHLKSQFGLHYIAKLSPSSSFGCTELVLISVLYQPASQPPTQPNSVKCELKYSNKVYSA